MKKRHSNYYITLSFVFFFTRLLAFTDADSTKNTKVVRPPKHYFSNTIYADIYSTGERKLDTINQITHAVNQVSKKLNSFQVSQFSAGFNIPVITKDIYNKDSTKISNIHFLLTGGYTKLNLKFGGISEHQLSKTSLGVRGVYNNGKKSIFFVDIAPFVTQDNGFAYTRTYRLASTFVYNYSANEYFCFRAGFTRSFLWGNRFNFPYVGIRVGKLDKVNFSVQFPRGASLNFPIGKYVRSSFYTKVQGGLYSFANTDSIQVGNLNDNKKLFFGRNEFLSGWRMDILPSKYFSAYLSTGFTTQNYISFSSSATATSNFMAYGNYYKQRIKPSIFLNIGVVVRFGKTKSIYNNYAMYNAVDINNNDIGNTGTHIGNGNIPVPQKKIKINNTNQILDLIETQDLY